MTLDYIRYDGKSSVSYDSASGAGATAIPVQAREERSVLRLVCLATAESGAVLRRLA